MDSEIPIFSVVIPVHNKEPHLHNCIKSVLNQTFNRFEVIIINDASSDNSLNEIKRFHDYRIQILHREIPGPGGYAARNLGIKQANAEWIAFLDADDEWSEDHLEKMYALYETYPNIFFMSAGWQKVSDKKKLINPYFEFNIKKGLHIIDTENFLVNSKFGQCPVWTSVACIKKQSPVAHNLFPDDKTRRGGDIQAWLKLICYHKEMAWSSHIGAKYNLDSINMVTKNSPYTYYPMSKIVYKELSSKLNEQERKLLRQFFNFKIKQAWLDNSLSGYKNFFVPNKLYWKGDFYYALFLSVISFTPSRILIFIRMVKRKLTGEPVY